MKSKPEKRPKMPVGKFIGTGSKAEPSPRANNLRKKGMKKDKSSSK